MAETKPWTSGSEIVRSKDTSLFHLRIWLSTPEDTRPEVGVIEEKKIVVAGCECTAYYFYGSGNPKILLALQAWYDPDLRVGGTPKLSTHMVLLDKTGSPATSMGTPMGTPSGTKTYDIESLYAMTAAWDDIKANCVVDKENYFDVRCSLDIDWTPSSAKEELPDLGHELAIMSDKQDLTDVSFDVGGESIGAHRIVLATRSPVFRAELFGPMAESNMASITVQDMEASTFRSMLHYMYHGSLSDVAGKDAGSTMAQYQHLLVAADRYGLEALKKICEDKLCGNGITIDNVVSMLELAEGHVCLKLKTLCLDFLADHENFSMVATSTEYLRLMQSFPNLLVEVRNRFKIAHEKPATMNPGAGKKRRVVRQKIRYP